MMNKIPAFLLLFLFLVPIQAYATRTVTSPYVEKNVLKVKSKTGVTHDDERKSRDGAWAQKFAVEYGVTERFSMEAESDLENAGDDNNTDMTALSLKGKVQLTEKRKYWLDAGVRLTYEAGLTDDPDFLEIKALLTKDTEDFRHMANFILTREVGQDAADEAEGGFSWSSRYKWMPEFEPGIEIYNNFGALADRPDFEDQDHSIGLVAYGKLGPHIKYEAGYLAGITENAADGRLKAVIEYGIDF